jgi:PAS domain S-box-containing protein
MKNLHDVTDTFIAGQNLILERIAAGASVSEVLTRLVRLVESQTVGMLCSILLLDEDGLHLRYGAPGSLPESYAKAIDGMSIGPNAGSCGTAVYLKKVVVVTDIERDSLWGNFRQLAKEHGLRACWSNPILLHTGQVLGSLAMYYTVPRGPIRQEQRLSEIAKHIASISIERSRAEQALKQSEERSRAILRAIPDSMFLLDSDFTYLECEPRSCCHFQMPPAAQLLGKNIRDVLPHELSERFERCFRRAFESGEPQLVEYEFRIDGRTRHCEARLIRTHDGKFLAVVRDITDRRQTEDALPKGDDRRRRECDRRAERRQAEETLREKEEELSRSNTQIRALAGRLMIAQEEERRRIARELQEDLNQKVAALSFVGSSIKYQLPARSEALDRQLDLLQRCAVEIAEGIRRLSHQLHPAVLEHVGLAAALRAYVSEFSRLEKIQIGLTVPDDVKTIPSDAAICLYRVAQESLCNIVQHSGANYAEVTLSLDDEAIHLRIADSGSGFDLTSAKKNGGLGLASMEERLRLMQGSFRVFTEPGGGAELLATIPRRK